MPQLRAALLVPIGLFLTMASAAAGPLSLRSFFDGSLTAHGTIEPRSGTSRTFTIAMRAHWEGPQGTLIEDIAYSDGVRDQKVWHFEKTGDGRFTGHREDVTDDAVVTEDGDGVRMVYKAKTAVSSALTLNLAFDDRLSLVAPDTVAVRSDVSYLFVPAATMTMTIRRVKSK